MRRIMSPKFSPAVLRCISFQRAGLRMLKVSPMPLRIASFAMPAWRRRSALAPKRPCLSKVNESASEKI